MLSHDNYVWTALSGEDAHIRKAKADGVEFRIVSYLPLSHVAAQYCDLFLSLCNASSVFFTDVNALKGTLIDYLIEVRPVIFLGVPRIYEKMEEKVKAALEKKPFIYKWATHYGQIGLDAVMKGRDPPIMYKVFDKLVYSKVRQNLGLDQCIRFFSGAAPLPLKTRQFFFNLGIFLNNTFGMSETTAPMTTLLSENYHLYDLSSAGLSIPGGEVSVLRTDPKSQHGELCFRGRNIFMGYLKNEQATRDCLDSCRRVHSGDEGFLTKDGVMHITGRLKELLVTAGGENVAPVIIEMSVKEELPFVSNVMALGDHRKYVAAMIALKVTSQASETPNRTLLPEAIEYLESQGIRGLKTVDEAVNNPEVKKLVQAGTFC
jgi:long-chain-fatty-acid--CoA ligase ACSBG